MSDFDGVQGVIGTLPDASCRSSEHSSDKFRGQAVECLSLSARRARAWLSVISLTSAVSCVPPCFPSTQIQVVSAAHQPLARASCGTEGFRNAKKGTGIAAQTAGIAAAAVSVCLSGAPCGVCWFVQA